MSARQAATAALLAAATVALLSACGTNPVSGSFSPVASSTSSTSNTDLPAPPEPPAAAPTATPAPTTTAPVGAPAGAGSSVPKAKPVTTTTTTTKPAGGDPTAPSGPSIDSFTASKPTCVEGGSGPAEVTVSWKVSNAQAVVLSVDGPGAYGTYDDAGHSAQLPFPCDGNTHSYTITPVGGHTSKTVTVTAKTTSKPSTEGTTDPTPTTKPTSDKTPDKAEESKTSTEPTPGSNAGSY